MRKIRTTENIDSRIKRIRWIALSQTILAVFLIVVFLDFLSLSRDLDKVEEYNYALVIERTKSSDSDYMGIDRNIGTLHDDSAQRQSAWEKIKSSSVDNLVDNVSEFLYTTQWDDIGFSITNTDGSALVVTFDRVGEGVTKKIIEGRASVSYTHLTLPTICSV